MFKISVYLNNKASQGNDTKWEEVISEHFVNHVVKFRKPESKDLISQLVKEDIKDQVDYIFAVGGDGTVNTLVKFLVGSNIKLLVIPTGTANDFARELGIDNLEKAISALKSQQIRSVDVIKVNHEYMITNGGIGLTSNVAHKINEIRSKYPVFKKVMKYTGSFIYSIFIAKEMIGEMKISTYQIDSPDFSKVDKKVKAPIIMVNNQARIGGKFLVAPNTKNNDGYFNVLIFKHTSRLKLALTILKINLGIDVSGDEDLIAFETNELVLNVIRGKAVKFLGDGEILEDSESFSVSVLSKSLDVCAYS